MFNWFKKKKSRAESVTEKKADNKIKTSVTGVNPQTENEFKFYNFVDLTFAPHLEKWYEQAKLNGVIFKSQYEEAIKQKIKTGEFKNPHSFPEYFDSKFDYISIDFETANKNRISACALGLVFVKNDRIAHQTYFHIKPPETEIFSDRHVGIHGITAKDVDYAHTFDELWEYELSKYFNQNLIVFHNASMDLSVLKNLFQYYNIENYNIKYLDTMQLAEKTNNSKKLTDLARKFDIKYDDKHNPEVDAKVCAYVFGELAEIYPNYENLIKKISFKKKQKAIEKKESFDKIDNQNLGYIQKYAIFEDELDNLVIEGKGFLFTGDITIERSEAKEFILENGGLIKPGATSKVDYVVVGLDYGWSKIQKVHKLNTEKNCNIKILTDDNFTQLMKKYAT